MFSLKPVKQFSVGSGDHLRSEGVDQPTIIRIATTSPKQFLIFGLLWQPLASAGDPVGGQSGPDPDVARQIKLFESSSEGYYSLQTNSTKSQYGFVGGLGDKGINLLSGGLAIQQVLGDGLALLAFNPSCYLVLAIEAGLILPDGEQIFKNGQDALERFVELSGQRAWPKRIADARFGLPDIESIDSPSMLKSIDYNVLPRMNPLPSSRRLKAGLRTVGFFVAGMGLLIYPAHRYHQQQLQNQGRNSAQAKALRDKQLRLDRWKNLPIAEACIAQASSVLGALPLEIAGWRLYKAEWSQAAAKAYYQVQEGYTSEQFAAETAGSGYDNQFMPGGKSAILIKKMRFSADDLAKRSQEKLVEIDALQSKCLSLVQMKTAEGKWEIKRPADSPPILNFTFNSLYDPLEILKHLPKDGLEPTAVVADISSSGEIKWKLSGNFYAKESAHS